MISPVDPCAFRVIAPRPVPSKNSSDMTTNDLRHHADSLNYAQNLHEYPALVVQKSADSRPRERCIQGFWTSPGFLDTSAANQKMPFTRFLRERDQFGGGFGSSC